jgi:hypothetical protein
MARLKVVNVFQGISGIPRDEYENSFYFQTASGDDVEGTFAEYATAAARVSNFYTGAGAGGLPSLSSYINLNIDAFVQLKVYDFFGATAGAHGDVDTGPPRAVYGYGGAAGGIGSTNGLPEEVALCLSYYSTSNTPRHRGRIYTGPFNRSALTANLASPPLGDLMTTLVTAGTRLSADGTSAQSTAGLGPIIPPSAVPSAVDGVNWMIRSRVGTGTPSAPVPTWERITKGWVDNGWDSQRRRRLAATSRVTFPS